MPKCGEDHPALPARRSEKRRAKCPNVVKTTRRFRRVPPKNASQNAASIVGSSISDIRAVSKGDPSKGAQNVVRKKLAPPRRAPSV
eukprot:1182755-Prorocentrum_minimum.AAC.2